MLSAKKGCPGWASLFLCSTVALPTPKLKLFTAAQTQRKGSAANTVCRCCRLVSANRFAMGVAQMNRTVWVRSDTAASGGTLCFFKNRIKSVLKLPPRAELNGRFTSCGSSGVWRLLRPLVYLPAWPRPCAGADSGVCLAALTAVVYGSPPALGNRTNEALRPQPRLPESARRVHYK